MILIINTDIIKLTIVDGLHQATLTCLIAVGHFNHFLLRGLALSACFPDMFWYQWTIKVKVKKKDQVKLSSDVSKMSSHPYYACSCPATDTSVAELISARRFASLSTGKLVCFLTCELHADCCWEPVNQWHVKLNLHRLLTLHPTLHPLTSLRLISSPEVPGCNRHCIVLECFPICWKTWTFFAANYFFTTSCDVAVWVRDCRGLWRFCVKLWVTTVALGLM